MSTAFTAISTAVATALAAAPAICHGVYTNLLDPIAEKLPTAVVVRLEQSTPDDSTIGALTWRTVLTVECHARGGARSDPAAAVDPLLKAVWQRLLSLESHVLGAMSLEVAGGGIEWQFDKAETVMACALIRVMVRHRTPTHDISHWT